MTPVPAETLKLLPGYYGLCTSLMRIMLDLVVANRRSQVVRITDCRDCIKLAFHSAELVSLLNTAKTQFLAFLLHIGIMVYADCNSCFTLITTSCLAVITIFYISKKN